MHGVLYYELAMGFRIYLDNCCFNRPYDDQEPLTIRMETEAKLRVQEMIKAGELALAWSYILDFENAANPCAERRFEIQRWESLADRHAIENAAVLAYMGKGVAGGLKPLDALHVACAMELECDAFLTVDKGILRKAGTIEKMKIMNPIDFIIEWEAQYG